jgi:hypothetical protein
LATKAQGGAASRLTLGFGMKPLRGKNQRALNSHHFKNQQSTIITHLWLEQQDKLGDP